MTNSLAIFGRVAVTHVQGSPKGGGAWTSSFQVTTTRFWSRGSRMRLQLIGNFSLNEFQEAISVVIKDLKFAEIDSLRNVNIYTGVCVQGTKIQFMESLSLIHI